MKAIFALPILAQAAQDDTSTLLSLKVQTTLETGVDHLLDAVGNRNVTQMSSLLQNLVEETISQGESVPYDKEITDAMEMIRDVLVKEIQGALKEAHCYDQAELHAVIQDFKTCEDNRASQESKCVDYCDGSDHKECRDELLDLYKVHITECRALDDFMKEFECVPAKKECCLLSHTTWNCGLCHTKMEKADVNGYFGVWLQEMVTKFEAAHAEWTHLHKQCTAAYKAYVEKDAKCDCLQADCETTNCKARTCRVLACERGYQNCWAQKLDIWGQTNTAKECLEKDRKIDWSATEKIKCYVKVLITSPTKEELLEKCGTEDCINKWREEEYKACNELCPEVDFLNAEGQLPHVRRSGDQDVTNEGENDVRTKHRAENPEDEKRCTAHLDLDYQLTPCCTPCEDQPEPPCTGQQEDYTGAWDTNSYMWIHYGQYGHFSLDEIEGFTAAHCHDDEHMQWYAYNLCTCIDCPEIGYLPPQVCTDSKLASACEAKYDYSKHDLMCKNGSGDWEKCADADAKCSDISDSENMAYKTQISETVEEE
jgi:hypothetical protein